MPARVRGYDEERQKTSASTMLTILEKNARERVVAQRTTYSTIDGKFVPGGGDKQQIGSHEAGSRGDSDWNRQMIVSASAQRAKGRDVQLQNV